MRSDTAEVVRMPAHVDGCHASESRSVRVLAVVVVHQRGIEEVAAWPMLQRLLRATGATPAAERDGLWLDSLLVYDNSPSPRADEAAAIAGCLYVHDAANGGTAAAYARSCLLAKDAGIDWLLLLDQDTELPESFLADAGHALARTQGQACALVPWVLHGSRVISPSRITPFGGVEPLRLGTAPVETPGLTAIASGSLLHVPTLASILPFPDGLWLDYVDHWLYLQLQRHGCPVAVFDARLQHDLSVFTPQSLSTRRLTSILDGEAAFVSLLGPRAWLVYPIRLAARVLRYARVRPDLARHTLSWMWQRIRMR